MRIIPSEEARKVVIASRGPISTISVMLARIQPGEVLEITPDDWKGKRPPYAIVNYFAKKPGAPFKKGACPMVPDGS